MATINITAEELVELFRGISNPPTVQSLRVPQQLQRTEVKVLPLNERPTLELAPAKRQPLSLYPNPKTRTVEFTPVVPTEPPTQRTTIVPTRYPSVLPLPVPPTNTVEQPMTESELVLPVPPPLVVATKRKLGLRLPKSVRVSKLELALYLLILFVSGLFWSPVKPKFLLNLIASPVNTQSVEAESAPVKPSATPSPSSTPTPIPVPPDAIPGAGCPYPLPVAPVPQHPPC